ncbi:MAG: competence protein ComEC [Saprospiraceae bacterium]
MLFYFKTTLDSCYKIPIIRFLLPYLCGILLCNYLIEWHKYVLIALSALTLIGLSITKIIRWQNLAILLFCLTLGLFSYKPISSEPLLAKETSTNNLQGQLIIWSLKKQNNQQLNFITQLDSIKYMVYLKKQQVNYLPGDTLMVEKFKIKLLSLTSESFSGYTEYLLSKGIKGQIFLKQKDVRLVKNGRGLFRTVYSFRQYLIQQIQAEKVFSPSQEGVFYSLLLGERSFLDKEIKEDFKESGIIHVLAISGLHVGILFAFIQGIFKALRIHNRYFKLIFVVILLLFYAIVAGLSPSVVRAGLMCCLIQFGLFIQEKNVIMNIVLSSALFLLLFKPLWIWDLGFLLSYFAVIFIVLVLENYKPLVQKISNPMLKKFVQLCMVNLAAFTGTFPILLSNFGVIYFGSILSSLVIIPLVTVLVMLGISTLIFTPIKIIFHFLLVLNKYLIQLLNQAATTFSEKISFPFTLEITVLQSVILYLMLFVVLNRNINLMNKLKTVAVFFTCILLSIF